MTEPIATPPGSRRSSLLPLAILVCILAGACGRDAEKPLQTESAVAPTVAVPSVASSPEKTTSSCTHTGRWAICNVEQRLRQAGFVARRMGGQSPKRPGFSVTPLVYSLGRSRLEVFVYGDEAALAREMSKIDTVLVAPAGVATPWRGTPLLIRSGNLAAVLIGDNPRQAERLALALTAGAPQPGSPR